LEEDALIEVIALFTGVAVLWILMFKAMQSEAKRWDEFEKMMQQRVLERNL